MVTKTALFMVVFSLFLPSGCKSVEPKPTAPLVGQLPEATQQETLIFGPESDILRTERGIEVQIVYESDVTYEILEQPGLKFSAAGFPDQYTVGLGRFYVFGQYVFVEHDWPSRYKHPSLVLTFQPSSPEVEKLAWDETVKLVVQEVKRRGIGFRGYASEGDLSDEKIRVYFELLEQDLLLQVEVNRFTTNDYEDKQMMPEWSVSWLPKVGRTLRRVEVNSGHLHPIAHQLLIPCLPKEIDIQLVQTDDGKRTSNSAIPTCINSILDDLPSGALELQITSRFESTYVPDFHKGKYVGEVKQKKTEWYHFLFEISVHDPALRQEIRREIRRAYDFLIECGRQLPQEEDPTLLDFWILSTGVVEVDSKELYTPGRECLAKVLTTRWKFAPREEEVQEVFGIRTLKHLPE